MRTLRDAFCRVGGAIAVAVAAAAGMIGPADARAQPAPPIAPIALPAGHFLALSYHDVAPSLRDSPERDTVETAALAQQFDWLRANGYTVVGIDELIAAQRGERPLPPKAVLLTFDDGYRSFYTQVFPLLKAFGYKATVALVGAWLDAPPGSTVIYDGKPVPRERFLDWDQIREMADSGLVELASHSYDAHHGVVANPQGNLMPALTARIWDSATGRYETPQQWRGRVHEDLRRNSELIERNAGRRPRVMVWPYGSYNGELVRIAASLGMPVAQTLDGGPNDVSQHLSRIRRKYVEFNPNIGQFASMIRDWDRTPAMLRPIHIDLDYAYDPDPAQQERNLDRLVERIKSSQAGTVFLQAFADPDGNGAADALYFPNRHLPMRADLFARAAWQLRTRANVEVYAWMPLMAFELPPQHPAAAHRVAQASGGAPGYPRLSPYSPAARAAIRELFEDLAQHAFLSGIVIHDDATLSDFEDDSGWARAHHRDVWRLPESVGAIRSDPDAFARWTRLKTEHLSLFAREVGDAVRRTHPGAKLARNYYARPILEPQSQAWFAQSLPDALAHFDWVALMAMPYMEGARDPERWLTALVHRVAQVPGALEKVVFEIQTRDWRSGQPLPAATVERHLRTLQRAGARSIGYYPDDFIGDQPPLGAVRSTISVRAPMSVWPPGPRPPGVSR